jgi:Holliday junction resolvase RusA-like endonuclease
VDVYEFLVPGRPVSVHERDRNAYREYQDSVFIAGARVWPAYLPFDESHPARVSIVFLCVPDKPLDVDNVVKPIMDALRPLYYADDLAVSDVDAHRRIFGQKLDVNALPEALKRPWGEQVECVYVRVQDAHATEDLP